MSEDFPLDATAGDVYNPAMDVQTEEEAEAYLQRVTRLICRLENGMSEADARTMALNNIGYWTGYCDHETADRVMALYHTQHPIFGTTHPTLEEALAKGMTLGEAVRRMKENEVE